MKGTKLTENQTLFLYVLLCNRSFCCKVECFHLCWGEGGPASLSAPSLMPSPLADHICASKRQRKGTLIDWHTVAGRLRNGDEQEATTQEIMLHNCQGTFTQPTGQPSGKQGTLVLTEKRGRKKKKKGIVWMFGVKVGLKKRGVWETHRQAERTKVFCLAGEDQRAQRQKKLCVYRDVASHYNA